VPKEDEELLSRTDEYNQAAEQYYVDYPDPEYLLNKPFSDTALFSRHLVDLAALVDGARLRPGDTVVEIGAGSCWLSHYLNRFGCRTIAIDISPTALDLGKQLFERDPSTRWELEPLFMAYDGRTLPLDEAACDGVVVNGSFHHIPNQRQLLAEMYRVLRPSCSVAMSEPGRGHSSAPGSVAESEHTGVLENELVLEDLAALAEAVGFRAVSVMAAGPTYRYEVPARELGRFMGGKGFARYWKALCASLDSHHYILMHKSDSLPTTERPGTLVSKLRIVKPKGAVTVSSEERLQITIALANLGNTVWLSRGLGETKAGWTRVGVHLYEDGVPPRLLDFDWYRAELDQDIGPGESVTKQLVLPPIGRAGSYLLRIDLVIEGALWFTERGTRQAELRVRARITPCTEGAKAQL
jgi:ubiquinone/menaquinone biosynthesis C-methylase UbiE